ncbi:MAG: hypothetical protein ACR2FM_03185 [Candidatus Saccharimonadales bacterium]
MNTKSKLKSLIFSQRLLASFALVLLIVMSAAGPILAQTVLQGYSSDEALQKGMLVALKKDDQSKIEAINDKNLQDLKGVVADANDSPVTISGDGQKIFVATEGSYEVLVSNENGSIEQGDYISGSSLAGIGMKANDKQENVAGRAIGKFEGAGDSIGKSTTKSGATVAFGRIQVDIGVTKNPLLKIPEKDKVPDGLQRIASTVAEKQVSTLRIYLAMMVLLISAFVAGTTLFSGVRSTVISVGRNPLSRGIIFKGLFQVLLLSLIIFITGLFGVYLLIKL